MPIVAGGGDYSVRRERMKHRFWDSGPVIGIGRRGMLGHYPTPEIASLSLRRQY
jgi:hypothetical protein